MSLSENKYVTGVVMIGVTLLLVVSLLIAGTSYFNTKEISALSSQCHENGGEETIEIFNNLTSEYSFECR
ncbi:hypothetical protein [Sporosarcina sp.]|uniref:hypothetical protein n=1 Tax=Sporosarcina sp. TaxID=49982 RepID=UPI00260646C8|nr:hypothetical protein [Sporosarcina sp.]